MDKTTSAAPKQGPPPPPTPLPEIGSPETRYSPGAWYRLMSALLDRLARKAH